MLYGALWWLGSTIFWRITVHLNLRNMWIMYVMLSSFVDFKFVIESEACMQCLNDVYEM